jgi:hypothetical protein
MAYQRLSDAWRHEVASQTLGALGALGGAEAQLPNVAELKAKPFEAVNGLNREISGERDRSDPTDQGWPDSQVRTWGPPKAPKAPKVGSADLDLRLHHVLDTLDSRCPDYIEPDRWRQAVEDGRCFLATWGTQAHVLGWTERDLFGLHQPPKKPHPMYRRLSRYDETGLIWLLQGREVITLTKETAGIRWPSGSITIYRKDNKPALGPLGDSLDDFE